MKKRLLMAVALLGVVAFATAGSATGASTTQAVYFLAFENADQTYTFDVVKAQGAGDLTVDTSDCCIHPDFWRATIDSALPANAANDVSGLGDGDFGFSGAATAHPFISGAVTVSYDHGVDIFPAGMCVRFTYSKSPGVEITAPAGAALLTGADLIAAVCGT
jgi:hypothetical protein